MSVRFDTLGEHPPFTEEEKDELRRLLHAAWQKDHVRKNESGNRHVRDSLSERMRWREGLMQKVGEL